MIPYKVIVAIRHRSFRDALRRILEEQPDLEIMGEAGEGVSLLELVRHSPVGPLLVILDAALPNLPWTEVLAKVKEDHRDTDVLIVSMYEDMEYSRQALLSGAGGYLVKEKVEAELPRAIDTIRRGHIFVPDSMTQREHRTSYSLRGS